MGSSGNWTSFLDTSAVFDALLASYCEENTGSLWESAELSQSLVSSMDSPISAMAAEKVIDRSISTTQAAFALFKSLAGPGLLFLPSGVKNAGLVSAPVVTAIIGAIATWSMLLALETAKVLRSQGHAIHNIGDIGFVAYGRGGRVVVNSAIVLSQLGFVVAYLVFIGENVQAVFFEAQQGLVSATEAGEGCGIAKWLQGPKLVYGVIVATTLLVIPFSWVRHLKHFATTNLVANLLILISISFMICSFAWELATQEHSKPLKLVQPSGTVVYFGTAMYAFEATSMMLPIERCMAEPAKIRQVVPCTMAALVVLQIGFSCCAYALYGEGTAAIVTVSLAGGDPLGGTLAVQLVQGAWILEVLFTLPLQLYPAAILIESLWLPDRGSGHKWSKNAIRSGLLLLCMAVATGGYSSVDNLVAIVGALGCCPLATVFPALFHYKLLCCAPKEEAPASKDASAREDVHQIVVTDHAVVQNERAQAAVEYGGRRAAACDLFILGLGSVGLALAAAMAVHSWIVGAAPSQHCVLLSDWQNMTGFTQP